MRVKIERLEVEVTEEFMEMLRDGELERDPVAQEPWAGILTTALQSLVPVLLQSIMPSREPFEPEPLAPKSPVTPAKSVQEAFAGILRKEGWHVEPPSPPTPPENENENENEEHDGAPA